MRIDGVQVRFDAVVANPEARNALQVLGEQQRRAAGQPERHHDPERVAATVSGVWRRRRLSKAA